LISRDTKPARPARRLTPRFLRIAPLVNGGGGDLDDARRKCRRNLVWNATAPHCAPAPGIALNAGYIDGYTGKSSFEKLRHFNWIDHNSIPPLGTTLISQENLPSRAGSAPGRAQPCGIGPRVPPPNATR
jgi:hypothetical protein